MVEKTFNVKELNLQLQCSNLLRAVADYIDYYGSRENFNYENLCRTIMQVAEKETEMSTDTFKDFIKDYNINSIEYKNKAKEFIENLTKKDILENLKFSAIDYHRLRFPAKDSKRITFKFLDLMIGYEVVVNKNGANVMSMPVTDVLLKEYKIKEAELYDAAMKNLPPQDEIVLMKCSDADMVAVNYKYDSKLGPLLLIDKTAIRQYANQVGADLYIALMSIHDICCITIKNGESLTIKKMGFREIVEEVNNQIDKEDIGSYSIYYYDRATDEVTIAVKGRNDP